MPDQDPHREALISLIRTAQICLVEAALDFPDAQYPIDAHLRLTGIQGGPRPMFSLTSPEMTIGQSHLPRGTLESLANRLLEARAPNAGSAIDVWRLNTARTIARFQLLSPPTAHELIELVASASGDTNHDDRF